MKNEHVYRARQLRKHRKQFPPSGERGPTQVERILQSGARKFQTSNGRLYIGDNFYGFGGMARPVVRVQRVRR